jgi:hypothetical protein
MPENAIADLENYLALDADSPEAQRIRKLLARLREYVGEREGVLRSGQRFSVLTAGDMDSEWFALVICRQMQDTSEGGQYLDISPSGPVFHVKGKKTWYAVREGTDGVAVFDQQGRLLITIPHLRFPLGAGGSPSM